MTPAQFIARWQNNPLSERAGAQTHFDDLCDLLGVDKPRDLDHYCFERGAGYPDRIVAKPGHEAELKKRTLTNLYNARPAWLDNAHKTLDAPVRPARDRSAKRGIRRALGQARTEAAPGQAAREAAPQVRKARQRRLFA